MQDKMVILLFVCGWISIINAQPNVVTLLPQERQTVCHGESISYNCIGNGTGMVLFSPPIVTESRALLVLNQGVQAFNAISGSAVAFTLVDPTGSPLFIVTYTVYVSDEQSEGEVTVFCRVSSADGMVTANETTFSVLGTPSPVDVSSLNFRVSGCPYENMMQVPVNVSWDSPENAQEFMLQIISKNMDFNITIGFLESNVTTFLPYYGTYNATLCSINRCGKTCQTKTFNTEPLPGCGGNNNSLVIALAVVIGILGLLFIVTCIYGVIWTVIVCTSKRDKSNAQTIPADEMKMK